MKYPSLIRFSLTAGLLLLVVLFVAGTLWGLLAALGDGDLAPVMKGIAIVALLCSFLNFVMLVVFLAFGQLAASEEPADEDEE